jgi:hypothetical protein
MGTLWEETPGGGWQAIALAGQHSPADGVRLVILGQGAERVAALMVRPGLPARVNGEPILGGLRLLGHKDEVLLGTRRLYYSAESRPVAVRYLREGESHPPACPVCRGPLRDGERAVRCPGCGRWYHQLEVETDGREKRCFTYAPACRYCRHPTDLSGGPVWSPAEEEAHV